MHKITTVQQRVDSKPYSREVQQRDATSEKSSHARCRFRVSSHKPARLQWTSSVSLGLHAKQGARLSDFLPTDEVVLGEGDFAPKRGINGIEFARPRISFCVSLSDSGIQTGQKVGAKHMHAGRSALLTCTCAETLILRVNLRSSVTVHPCSSPRLSQASLAHRSSAMERNSRAGGGVGALLGCRRCSSRLQTQSSKGQRSLALRIALEREHRNWQLERERDVSRNGCWRRMNTERKSRGPQALMRHALLELEQRSSQPGK